MSKKPQDTHMQTIRDKKLSRRRKRKKNRIKKSVLLAWPFLLVLFACPSDLHTQVCSKNSPVVAHMPGKKQRHTAYELEHTGSERFMDERDFCLQVL